METRIHGTAEEPNSDRDQQVRYLIMGQDGIYLFQAPWERIARDIGFITAAGGFTLIGIDGLNGCNLGGTVKW